MPQPSPPGPARAQPHFPAQNPYSQPDQTFWTDYLSCRPHFPDSFFQRIFDYHAANAAGDRGEGWQNVHDAGAGPGIHSPRLAHRFEEVVVSDAAEGNVALARAALGAAGAAESSKTKYSFHISKFESSGEFLAEGSLDLIFAATMLHYCDVSAALHAAAFQLGSGGTLAIALAAIAVLDDPTLQAKWLELMHAGCEGMYARLRAAWGEERFQAALRLNASGYDDVGLDEEVWESGALRVRFADSGVAVPGEGGGAWYDTWVPPGLREEYPRPPSQVGSSERVICEDGEGEEWRFQMDCQGLRKNLETFPFDFGLEKMVALWAESEQVVGERVVEGRWPSRLILATRG